MAYVGNQPVPQATQTRDRFVATSGQTSFATSGYTPNFVDVYLDGVKLDSSEYTATNGSDVVLASGASTGQIMEVVAFSSFDVADIRNMTQPLGLKNYTTTQRDALTGIGAGDTIYNSTVGSIQFYDGTNWVATNLIPVISSISGDIYTGVSSTLTISVSNATDTVDIKYYEGNTLLATDTGVTVTSGSCTSTVPSAVYGQTAGDTITIQIFNLDATPSNGITKTVQAIPTGGTVTTSGSYVYHTFNSSSTFTVPSGFSSTYDALIVAGGGAGGSANGGAQGGGGAGGAVQHDAFSLSAGSFSVVIGAGGTGSTSNQVGNSGSNTTGFSQTAIGGGGGDLRGGTGAASGGSGGGGSSSSTSNYGTGTSGQGNRGGLGNDDTGGTNIYPAGGGGGAGAVGGSASQGSASANGGDGINWKSLGTYYAGGGAGGAYDVATPAGSGGQGGGGDGVPFGSNASSAHNGNINTGGGGGGGASGSGLSGAGGSGIVVIRYQL